MVKNPPAMQETWFKSLGWEESLEQSMVTHSSILAWRIPMDRGARRATVHGVAESDTTEQLCTEHNDQTTKVLQIIFELVYFLPYIYKVVSILPTTYHSIWQTCTTLKPENNLLNFVLDQLDLIQKPLPSLSFIFFKIMITLFCLRKIHPPTQTYLISTPNKKTS